MPIHSTILAGSVKYANTVSGAAAGTLGFCTIPDTRAAAAEALRVLRAGGHLLLLEHVRSPAPIVRSGQRLLEPLAVRFEADQLLRDPLNYLPDVGFEIDEVQRSKWGIVERLRALKPGP